MTLKDCEERAKEEGFDSMEFTAFFPAGPKKCVWLDAYMGLFRVEGLDGFVMVSQMEKMFPDLVCSTV